MQLLLSQEVQVPGARNLAPDELRGHMEERFSWAVSRGHSVCALACEPLGLERIELRNPGISPRVLGALALALEPAFRATEAIVERDDGCLVVLLVGPDPVRIEAACREWVAGAKELRVEQVAGPLSLRIGYGVTQPGKRLFLDTLIQVAREGLRVALCRAPGACVHTLLYDFLQGRFERERGTEGIAVTASAPLPPDTPARGPGMEAELPEIAAATSGVREPSSQRRASGNEPREERMSVPLASGPAPMRASELTDPGHREQELSEALDAQRRENDALRARLQALEERDVPPVDASRGAQDSLAAPGSAQDRIDVLERRLAKLRLSLAEAEEHLARASRESVIDSGIASTYRTVQGLDADAPHVALKAALMEKIFVANLELHGRLRCRQVSAQAAP
jgi:hypothetical protein